MKKNTLHSSIPNNLNYWFAYLCRYYIGNEWSYNRFKEAENKLLEASKTFDYGETGHVTRIPFKELNLKDFKKHFLATNKPIVLEGFAEDWPALKKWDSAYFEENYGEEIIPVRLNTSTISEETVFFEKYKLKDFIGALNKGEDVYASNIEDIANNNPELRDDLNIKQLSNYTHLRANRKIISTQFFISNSRARSGLHCALTTNMFTQVTGQKKWTLIDPRYSKWLHILDRKDMLYAATDLDYNKPFEQLDKEGYPLFKYVPKIELTLNPGDGLLVPQWWWHSVDNIGFSIGVASRGSNYRNIFKGNPLFTLQALGSKKIWDYTIAMKKNGWSTDRTSVESIFVENKR
ncbi:cupin-like domain-containing protein [Maribacter sp. 2-571]|uniref:cupin-like domain-containing protein n=1 Tax=Maribacter sp. 2-571 TaxID=3417569 RepID=UPI003D32E864